MIFNIILNQYIYNQKMSNLPPKRELTWVLEYEYPRAKRDDKQRWTNCEWFHLNYIKPDREGKEIKVKLYIKKSFLRWIPIDVLEKDVTYVKQELLNIIPNQAFIPLKDDIFIVCSPVNVICDVLDKQNYKFVVKLATINPKLLRQFKFFVTKYEKMINEWKILDLHWAENLVISDVNKLYYIDSLLLFHDNEMIKTNSMKNYEYLKKIIEEVEKANI